MRSEDRSKKIDLEVNRVAEKLFKLFLYLALVGIEKLLLYQVTDSKKTLPFASKFSLISSKHICIITHNKQTKQKT